MISKISIKNFRSIKSLEFEPNNLCALVGQNNVGKSNILAAVDLLLGEKWPLNKITTDDIYNHDERLSLQIRIQFDKPMKHKYYGSEYEVHGLHLEYNVLQNTQKLLCLDDKENFILNPWKNPVSANNELREKTPCVLVEVDRDLEKELRASQWTIFGKLLKDIEEDFQENEALKSDYDCKMDDACGLLRTTGFNTLETVLREQVKKLTGFTNADLKFRKPNVLEHYKSLNLTVRESPSYDEFSALDMGAGIQSAIFISIMEAYRQIKKAGSILLIEEPEVYLHPHARRYFYRLLSDLAQQGNQVFYSTHSTEFVNLPEYDSICLIRKTPAEGTILHQVKDLDITSGSKEELKLLTQFDARRNEMFFSQKVLLVEGPTEKFSLPYLFRLKGVDLNDRGISIIDTESKDNLEYFIKILAAFSMPFVVLHDEDSNKPDYMTKHNTLNQKILAAAVETSLVFSMKPDFEGVFGLPNKDIRKAIARCKSIKKIEDIPSTVNSAIDKLLSL